MSDRRRLIAGLVGVWLALVVTAVFVGVPRQRDAIAAATVEALTAAGIEATVSVEGRDVVLDLRSDADEPAAREAVATVPGVRTVDFRVIGDERGPDPVPPTTSSSTSSTTTTTVPSTAFVRATLHRGLVSLEGRVPSPELVEAVGRVVELIYAPLVDGFLEVAEVPPAPWLRALPKAVAVLPIVSDAELTFTDDRVVVAAEALSEERKAKFLGTLTAILGPDVEVVDEVAVTGLEPSTFHAEAPGDGTLRMWGRIPDDEVAAELHRAALEAYGEGRVADELVVDPGVAPSFSLFRLPFVLPQLARVPQWSLHIDDDVITGSLRGGATFPSGSAELSPELEALLQVAAGILTRNPTLGFVIEGHTDWIGTKAANQRLSERRANAGKDYLVALGVEPERIVAVGYGERRPIATNETPEGRAQNRRLEFRFGPLEHILGGN